jgi:hypothetical protein
MIYPRRNRNRNANLYDISLLSLYHHFAVVPSRFLLFYGSKDFSPNIQQRLISLSPFGVNDTGYCQITLRAPLLGTA